MSRLIARKLRNPNADHRGTADQIAIYDELRETTHGRKYQYKTSCRIPIFWGENLKGPELNPLLLEHTPTICEKCGLPNPAAGHFCRVGD